MPIVLNPVSVARHGAVGASVLVGPVLVMMGVLGGGTHEERFDAKQVLVTPVGGGVRIREVVDEDFGSNDRHGYERVIPNDFGAVTDVAVSSPDAPDQFSMDTVYDPYFGARIRIGDPDTTISGQHRYLLTYTLPEANLSSGRLALDIIGTDEKFETGRFEVVVAGFELTDTKCNVGSAGTEGGCSLVADGDLYRVVFQPLKPGEGITIRGTIVSTTNPPEVAIPAPVSRRSPDKPVPLALGAGGLGALAAGAGFGLARRLGRNEVGGAGAADAAYAVIDGPTRLVADSDLDAMATTEFVPPTGLRPWQGAMLLSEKLDTASVSAWFSDQIAVGVLELRGEQQQTLVVGPNAAKADAPTQDRVASMLGTDGTLTLGQYQPALAMVWKQVQEEQRVSAAAAGWWRKFPPGTEPQFPVTLTLVVVGLIGVVALAAWQGLLMSWPVALGVGLLLPTVVAAVMYRRLLPVRSAAGTALALRTESFRRFLEASEGTHVDWAWKNGLLREYSAWAVALGAAGAWGRAISASSVPPPERVLASAPMIVYGPAWGATHTAPAPASSGGGGGGFSGGSVGGGGGGGSSGSW